MAINDLKTNTDPRPSLAPAAYLVTTNGAACPIAGANNFEIFVHVGTWTNGTHTLSVQEFDAETSTWANVPKKALHGWDYWGPDPEVDLLNASGHYVIASAARNNTAVIFNYVRSGSSPAVTQIRVVNTVTGAPANGATLSATIFRSDLRSAGMAPSNSKRWAAEPNLNQ